MKEYLNEQGVTEGTINLGGNVLCIGPKQDGSNYRIGIQMPFEKQGTAAAVVEVTDQTVVSSGVYERYMTVDDRLYHHILNPATGKGVQVDYPDFSTVAFWTPANIQAPFLCVEPWNGAAIFADEDNHFANKRDIQILSPGETKSYRLTIRLLS